MTNLIYDYDRRLNNAIRNLKRSSLSSTKKEQILGFVDYSISEGIGEARVQKYIGQLVNISIWLGKPFERASEEDIREVVRKIKTSGYVDFTKAEHRIVLKKFYKWLRKTNDYPPEVAWLRPRGKISSTVKMPEELLTEDDIKAMIISAKTERNRALIAMLYESGCRIGEILPIRIKHIAFDNNGSVMSVDGKTGPRRVRLVNSIPYLKAWLNNHTDINNPESFVWIKSNGELMGYPRAVTVLKNAAKMAGIKKRIYPHLFRHTRATHLANHLTEAQMKEYFGWVQASEMAGVYVHMSGRDVDNAILSLNGIKTDENEERIPMAMQKCPGCKKENGATYRFCYNCGTDLHQEPEIPGDEKNQGRIEFVTCESCRSKVPTTFKFCFKCGEMLGAEGWKKHQDI